MHYKYTEEQNKTNDLQTRWLVRKPICFFILPIEIGTVGGPLHPVGLPGSMVALYYVNHIPWLLFIKKEVVVK